MIDHANFSYWNLQGKLTIKVPWLFPLTPWPCNSPQVAQKWLSHLHSHRIVLQPTNTTNNPRLSCHPVNYRLIRQHEYTLKAIVNAVD